MGRLELVRVRGSHRQFEGLEGEGEPIPEHSQAAGVYVAHAA